MAFLNEKITEDDLLNRGVLGQPDVPGLSAAEMQFKVEEIVREVVIPRFNDFVDKVSLICAEKTEVDNVAEAFSRALEELSTGISEDIDKAATDAAAAVEALEAKTTESMSAFEQSTNEKIESFETETNQKLSDSSSENNMMFNALKTEIQKTIDTFDQRLTNLIIEGGAVVSVFGRIGEVAPQAGDYTAEMVGAAPEEHSHSDLLSKDGGVMQGDISMGGNKITGLWAPTDELDGANKKYVDEKVAAVVDEATKNIVTDVFAAGPDAPANKKLLWIDSENAYSIKFYNAAEDIWQNVSAVWS